MADALIAKEFAGYRIESRIGRGGMGVVYRATDLALDRSVALKVLADHLADDQVFRQRFVAESKLAASLDHPNVIPIHAAGECEGTLYLAMRLVPGDDLRSVLRTDGPLEPDRAARLVAQIGAALDAAHARGLIHRDVKPANILLTPDEHVYLTDFGLSKRIAADTAHTRAGEVMGTLDYIAPEQIRRESLGPFTDVYALGCMTFQLLTGRVPFPMESEESKLWAQLSEPPPRPSALVPALGKSFDTVVRRAMSKKPTDRYASAGDLGAALLAASAATPRDHQTPRFARLPAVRGAASASVPDDRRQVLVAALTDRFNLVLLAALLTAGILLGTTLLMLPLAVAVYAAGVVRSYRDPDTRRQVASRSREPS